VGNRQPRSAKLARTFNILSESADVDTPLPLADEHVARPVAESTENEHAMGCRPDAQASYRVSSDEVKNVRGFPTKCRQGIIDLTWDVRTLIFRDDALKTRIGKVRCAGDLPAWPAPLGYFGYLRLL
jgi:hypothetical protein